ncbi:MAG: hypothetical protein SZ59_C0001G0035 [candidate division TM6 bacterium GW2011_GWF2_28_16]|nr:MAG: hypothetical protein SZ59_C0001G0035 [candidate division TM6 bacterium GW2011_GWF2_28_16]
MKNYFKYYILKLIILLLVLSGCVKNSKYSSEQKDISPDSLDYQSILLKKEELSSTGISKIQKQAQENRILEINIQNITGKAIYVACFSYIKRHTKADRWRWDKSKIYMLNANESTTIKLDTIVNKENRENIYGYLAVFDKEKDAINSTYELLEETKKLDLDRIYLLKNKTVKIGIEKYGFKGNLLSTKITEKIISGKIKPSKPIPELDFYIKNRTGKKIYIAGFIYQKQIDTDVWYYDKTDIYEINDKETILMDIDTINDKYNRVFARGFLGVFNENQKEEAEKSTYETLPTNNKLALGTIAPLKGRVVVVQVEKYGMIDNFLEFAIIDKK